MKVHFGSGTGANLDLLCCPSFSALTTGDVRVLAMMVLKKRNRRKKRIKIW
jgi:hypothetical protein